MPDRVNSNGRVLLIQIFDIFKNLIFLFNITYILDRYRVWRSHDSLKTGRNFLPFVVNFHTPFFKKDASFLQNSSSARFDLAWLRPGFIRPGFIHPFI